MKTTTNQNDAALDNFREAMASGKAFAWAWQSHQGRRLCYGPVPHDQFAHAVKILGQMAAYSDAGAQVAARILHVLPLYQTKMELCAVIWREAMLAIEKPYDDVVGRAAPDAHGRPSSYIKAWTMGQRIVIYAFCHLACEPMNDCAPGYGWALQGLAREHNVFLPKA